MPLAIDKGSRKDLGKLEKPVYIRVTEGFDEFDRTILAKKLGPPRIVPTDGIDEA
ncbi:hypothetical protein [Mycolicibacterium tusciae]|uniref:hypothetical protein n=1 Tax=Mycolicibacterium tusciae TaxID=75922 RepID=UPI0013FE45D4|nr:hypothetical protein [Mycolicibacterium tusciae]